MPLYEYRCSSCDEVVEVLQSMAAGVPESCPSCDTVSSLSRVLSMHAVGATTPGGDLPMAGNPACMTCSDPRGPGACGMN